MSGPGVLVTVGDLVEDVVVWHAGPTRFATDNPSVVHRARGGSAANVAAFASSLVPARFIGCIGADPAGDTLIAELAGRGVDVRAQRPGPGTRWPVRCCSPPARRQQASRITSKAAVVSVREQ